MSIENNQINPEEESEESFEVDREFVLQGFQNEVARAEQKEREGKEEHYGRTTFVAARSAELGINVDLSEDVRQKMEEGLAFKRKHETEASGDAPAKERDPWGMAFTARYLKNIDPERYSVLDFNDEEKRAMLIELQSRQIAAETDPSKWGPFFVMAEHVKEVEPEIYEALKIDEQVEQGLQACLNTLKEKNLTDFINVALAAERCSPGILETIGVKEDALSSLDALVEEAEEDKEKGDVWAYTFKLSQAEGLKKTLR